MPLARNSRLPARYARIHHLRAVAVLPLLGLMLLGCGADEGWSELQRSIVNGQLHSGHPAVGGLFQERGGMCTATLVGKRTVLTAAHCVEPGYRHLVILGDNMRWDVESVTRHPNYDAERISNDVAIVRLSKAPAMEPARIAVLPPELGQRVSLLGLGATSSAGNGSGRMRIAQNVIYRLLSDRITYRFGSGDVGNLCFGDSGGPTFATVNGQEVQVGVHSYISGQCGQEGTDMRVDAFLSWISTTAGGDVLEGGAPDVTPPTVSIVAPNPADELYPKLTVAAEVSDEIGIGPVELFIDGSATGQPMKQSTGDTTGRYEVAVELTPGEHSVEVIASDTVGNKASAKQMLTIVALKDFGEVCTKDPQCATALCADVPALEKSLCSQACDPKGAACPQGARCEPAGSTFVCGAPAALLSQNSGCAVGGDTPAGSWPLLALLLALAHAHALARRTGRRLLTRR